VHNVCFTILIYWQYCAFALHAGCLSLQTHTQNMLYLLLFRCNNGCTKTLQCYVIRTLPLLSKYVNREVTSVGYPSLVGFEETTFWPQLLYHVSLTDSIKSMYMRHVMWCCNSLLLLLFFFFFFLYICKFSMSSLWIFTLYSYFI
jgi:hypothetical protein